MSIGKDWDERERIKHKTIEESKRSQELFKIYIPLVEKYAKLNNIELPSKDNDDYTNSIYGFVWDAKFIDFAYDESGIVFSKDLYEFDKECNKLLIDDWLNSGSKSAVSCQMFQIYSPLVDEYVKLNNIKIPSIDTENEEHMKKHYSFVHDPKFLDFAFKKSGIMFNEQMFDYFDENKSEKV